MIVLATEGSWSEQGWLLLGDDAGNKMTVVFAIMRSRLHFYRKKARGPVHLQPLIRNAMMCSFLTRGWHSFAILSPR
jgi:hypothetical protein